ncbi:hypothetical protein DDB_G0276533 [Dictyostelium discoideum AX4]|uniref:Uncharacterized protein n=1 Tax=Dictyostelium discoideum TaxID=44689 RepID=Q551N1_DICDI|nr:hypothetical protein DDB_G0276533 [Dictyostelium discoideum AX4]EAL69220.1 hypothetical protein DDB_G0276533 [Dictyostelium discoideum AX4]|eukprot:XP_643088.1 hypothetical protein DDB_G0276533 [Dictyostelium discoideum AX4]
METTESDHKLLLRDRDNNGNNELKNIREELFKIQQLFKQIDYSVFNLENKENIEKADFSEDFTTFSSLSTTSSSFSYSCTSSTSSINSSSSSSSSSSSFCGVKRYRDSREIDISDRVKNPLTFDITNVDYNKNKNKNKNKNNNNNNNNKTGNIFFEGKFSTASSLSSNPKNDFYPQNSLLNNINYDYYYYYDDYYYYYYYYYYNQNY